MCVTLIMTVLLCISYFNLMLLFFHKDWIFFDQDNLEKDLSRRARKNSLINVTSWLVVHSCSILS